MSKIVKDALGPAVVSSTVTVTNAKTSTAARTTTDEAGNYLFPRLSPASYNIVVKKAGFKSSIISGLTLLVDQEARIDARLEVGAMTTTVEVSGAAPLVETTTASVGTVIGEQQVVDLPLNLRRYGALALLVPGTVPENGGFGNQQAFSETAYGANVARTASNNFLIEGVDSRELSVGGFGLQPPPDAVQEFKSRRIL